VFTAKQTRRVQSVSKSSETECGSYAQFVCSNASKEAHYGECAVQCYVCVVCGIGVAEVTAAQTVQGILHPGAEETDKGD
jgi:hypothetical protein